jgi:hypothetical protein
MELRSDGRSTYHQATAGLSYYIGITRERSPVMPAPRFHGKLDLSYTYAAGRERTRGFDATTAGDPRALTRSVPPQTPRHSLQIALTGRREGWFSITFAGQLASGLPYTPLVGGDVNGDGLANDRAFVFDPAAATDSALGAGMRRLLDDAPRRVRDCLARQLGAIAAERSCRGPWYATLGVIALRLDPYRVGFRDRGSISLYVTNALGGIDQLLHGSAGRRGWGDVALPDAALLAARGFDAARPRYRYAVNPRFGSTAATGALFRRPAGLTIDVRVELGPDREGQALRNMFRPRPGGWGWPTDADSLRRFLYVQSGAPVEGDVSALLRRAGALRLTRVQVDTLTAIRARLAATRDSLYADLARFLAAREGDYGDREVRARWHRAVLASLTSDYEASRRLRDVLTPAQIAALEVQEWPPHFLSRTPDWFAQVTRGPLTYPW